MKTNHKIFFKDSKKMRAIPSSSAHLVVTSPPYPMIEMWDDLFRRQSKKIDRALKNRNAPEAFELMHQRLDPVWHETYRILVNGGIACINIGDAARTINDNFTLYANHARILTALLKTGFNPLPLILWRKPTNAPNKFMGSGMLPAGAYVTLEHEYILIVRKGNKREFDGTAEKQNRRESALFWEERNNWFSDVWLGLIGTQQKLKKDASRLRSGAFPFELAYRLVNMYSVKGDTVVDPFLGTGTTLRAAIAAARNSIGYEIETDFGEIIAADTDSIAAVSNERIRQRIQTHLDYLKTRSGEKGKFKYVNRHYKFPVMTRQEVELFFNPLESIDRLNDNTLEAMYADLPDREFNGDWKTLMPAKLHRSKSSQLQ
ncbi:MAG: site-specific DNA-methyltransferase [Desulfobacterales bacterium]|nr:MAG: site-specific DNA-methyltransferase [Desulfobacterales bacterium]